MKEPYYSFGQEAFPDSSKTSVFGGRLDSRAPLGSTATKTRLNVENRRRHRERRSSAPIGASIARIPGCETGVTLRDRNVTIRPSQTVAGPHRPNLLLFGGACKYKHSLGIRKSGGTQYPPGFGPWGFDPLPAPKNLKDL